MKVRAVAFTSVQPDAKQQQLSRSPQGSRYILFASMEFRTTLVLQRPSEVLGARVWDLGTRVWALVRRVQEPLGRSHKLLMVSGGASVPQQHGMRTRVKPQTWRMRAIADSALTTRTTIYSKNLPLTEELPLKVLKRKSQL